MSMWTAIVVIVAIGCFTEIMRAKYRARAGIFTERERSGQAVG